MWHTGKIFLTGASGFIGSHVMEALCAEGFEVVAFARPQSRMALAHSLGVEVRYGDLENFGSLLDAIKGCDQVIHTAGLAADWGRAKKFKTLNVYGTLNVLGACSMREIEHAVITGSISSYGEEDCAVAKDEAWSGSSHYPYFLDWLFPCALNYYRDSKATMTQLAMLAARMFQMNLTVLEPAWVYGEREFNTGFYSYLKAVQSGMRWMPGSLTNKFHVIYARDLAQAYVLAAKEKLPGRERIIVANPYPAPMHRIFDQFCVAAGLEPPRRLPKWAAYPVGFGMELVSTLTLCRQPPLLTRGRVNMFYDSIQYSPGKAARLLGFMAEHSLEEGIGKTVEWYKANGFL